MKKKLTFLSYLISPLLLTGCFLFDNQGLVIASFVLLILYVVTFIILRFIIDLDSIGVGQVVPSHVIRLFLKKVIYPDSSGYYIYKDTSYNSVTLLDWSGFFLRKVKRYPNFKSFMDSAKSDIDNYIQENKSTDTYYGFDGFISNEDRIAHNRDKKLNKIIKK